MHSITLYRFSILVLRIRIRRITNWYIKLNVDIPILMLTLSDDVHQILTQYHIILSIRNKSEYQTEEHMHMLYVHQYFCFKTLVHVHCTVHVTHGTTVL